MSFYWFKFSMIYFPGETKNGKCASKFMLQFASKIYDNLFSTLNVFDLRQLHCACPRRGCFLAWCVHIFDGYSSLSDDALKASTPCQHTSELGISSMQLLTIRCYLPWILSLSSVIFLPATLMSSYFNWDRVLFFQPIGQSVISPISRQVEIGHRGDFGSHRGDFGSLQFTWDSSS